MQAIQFQLNYEIELKHWWFVGRRGILHRLIGHLVPANQSSLVVDVGCGTGANLGMLADRYQCVGIDPSAEAVDLARRRFPQVAFACGHAPRRVSDEFARAQVITMTDVLEHVEDDFAQLSELLAAARPGAHFILTVPADLSLWSPHDESHHHWRRYDVERFTRLWQGLNVSTLMVSHFNSRLYPLIRGIRSYSRHRGKASGREGTDLKLPPAWLNRRLERLFAGEGSVLADLLLGKRRQGYRRGVSLIAVLRRGEGRIRPRRMPADVVPYHFNPLTQQRRAA